VRGLSQVLKASHHRNSTVSPGNLVQCLPVLPLKSLSQCLS